MAGMTAPEGPEEPEVAAPAVVRIRFPRPPNAANSNAGCVATPRPPQWKERRLSFLSSDRKHSGVADTTAPAPSTSKPSNLQTALPTSVFRHSFLLKT
jgi:hypothetical protein